MEEQSQTPLGIDRSPLEDALSEVHEVYGALQQVGFQESEALQIVSNMISDLVGARGMLEAYVVEDDDDDDDDEELDSENS